MSLVQPDLRAVPNSKNYRLAEPYEIVLPVTGHKLCVDAGVLTDGASIPPLLWVFVGSGFDPSFSAPSFVHDCLCRSELVPRIVADLEFRALMRANGKKARRLASVFFVGVRIGALLGIGKPHPSSRAAAREKMRWAHSSPASAQPNDSITAGEAATVSPSANTADAVETLGATK